VIYVSDSKLQTQSDTDLINEVKNGSGDAFGVLAERYNYIITYNIAKLYSSFKFPALNSEREDLFQECCIILYKAAKYYDFVKNVKFSTYVNICIKNYLISLCRKYGKAGKYAGYDFVPLDEIRENESGRYDRYFAFTDINSFPETFFDALTAFEKKVLMMYIENQSYKHMAESLNKSVKSIDNAVCRIKTKLKPYAEYFVSEY
jgi:RNA polymerase sporulation-specific sigma factor